MKKVFVLSFAAAAGVVSAQSFSYFTTGNVPIPDGTGAFVSLPLVIVDNRTITGNVTVDVIIQHTWQGDVRFDLVAPNGDIFTLVNQPGVPQSTFGHSADNYGNPATGGTMDFNDSGASIYDLPFVASPGIANVTGVWDAEGGSLNTFAVGRNLTGTWQLRAADFAASDLGAIQRFSLSGNAVPEPASLAALGIAALALIRRRKK